MTLAERKWFLVNALPLLYLFAAGAMWWFATPQGFQRFGSIGVMVAALMFGLDRLSRRRRGRPIRGSGELMSVEVTLVAISTFQWGYGDLFHCWTRGEGWEVCY